MIQKEKEKERNDMAVTNENQMADEDVIDLLEIFYLLKRRLLIILASILLCTVCAGAVCEYVIVPKYQSTTKLYILNTTSSSLASLSLSDLQVGASLTNDYMELIQSRPAVEEVIDRLHLDMIYEQMLGKMTIENKTNTRILSITIEDEDPYRAKQIADAFADVAIKRLSEIMSIQEPHLVEEGHVSEFSVNQDLRKYLMIGALIGLLLSCGIIIMRYLLDDSIHSSEDIEKYLGLNTLAMIPLGESEYDGRSKRRKRRKKKEE